MGFAVTVYVICMELYMYDLHFSTPLELFSLKSFNSSFVCFVYA